MKLTLILLASLAFAQTPAEIEALDKAWGKAILSKDVKALDAMLADDLIYGHASNIVDTKKDYLAKIGSGKQVYKTLEQKNVTVKLHGDTAITQSWMRITGVNQSGPFDDKVMLLHVWQKQGNTWKMLAHQTAKVDKLP